MHAHLSHDGALFQCRASSSGSAPVDRSAPARNSRITLAGSSSDRMTATVRSFTPSSSKTSLATSIIQSRLRLPPAMPQLPRMTGPSMRSPASTMWRKSAFTASRSKYSVPVPR
ncbi:hypothetical protein BMR85_002370 [Achromobacter sp. KAs 3-5]|nr:hypothetical protein BMR85_002370 [Achromobacter sp. KAs 3-5]